MKLSLMRKITILLFVVLAVVALAFHTGTGNLSSLGWDAIAYICPLGGIEAMLASMTLIPRPIIALVVLVAFAFIFGKVFCAWVCPIPPIKQFFRISTWRTLLKPKDAAANGDSASNAIANSTDGEDAFAEEDAGVVAAKDAGEDSDAGGLSLSTGCDSAACTSGSCSNCAEKRKKLDSRHVVLGGALLSTAMFGFPVFCLVCPVGLVFATIVAWWRFVGFAELALSLVAFPAILLLEVLVLRKWCLKFCPLGAVMSLMSIPNRFFRPKVDMEKCLRNQGIECTKCVDICEEHLDPHDTSGMHECSKCGMCVENCPAQAISLPFSTKQVANGKHEIPDAVEVSNPAD